MKDEIQKVKEVQTFYNIVLIEMLANSCYQRNIPYDQLYLYRCFKLSVDSFHDKCKNCC